MRMHHRMPGVQAIVAIIWCRATVRARAPTLHNHSIEYTYSTNVHKSELAV